MDLPPIHSRPEYAWVEQSILDFKHVSAYARGNDADSHCEDTVSLLQIAIESASTNRHRETIRLPNEGRSYVDRRINRVAQLEADHLHALWLSHPMLDLQCEERFDLRALGITYTCEQVANALSEYYYQNVLLVCRTFSGHIHWMYSKRYNTNQSVTYLVDMMTDDLRRVCWVAEAYNIIFPGWGIYNTFEEKPNASDLTEHILLQYVRMDDIYYVTSTITPLQSHQKGCSNNETVPYLTKYLDSGGHLSHASCAVIRKSHVSLLPRAERIMTNQEFGDRVSYWLFTKMPNSSRSHDLLGRHLIHLEFDDTDPSLSGRVYVAKRSGRPWRFKISPFSMKIGTSQITDHADLPTGELLFLTSHALTSVHFRNLCDCATVTLRAIGVYRLYQNEMPEYYIVLRILMRGWLIDIITITSLTVLPSYVLPFIVIHASENGVEKEVADVVDILGLYGLDSPFYHAYVLKGSESSYQEFLSSVNRHSSGMRNVGIYRTGKRLFGYHLSLYARSMLIPRYSKVPPGSLRVAHSLSYLNNCGPLIAPAIVNINDMLILPCGYVAGNNSRVLNSHMCVKSLFRIDTLG